MSTTTDHWILVWTLVFSIVTAIASVIIALGTVYVVVYGIRTYRLEKEKHDEEHQQLKDEFDE